MNELQHYWVPAALVIFFAWRFLKARKVKGALPALREQGAVVVDVRSVGEFAAGSSAGSINIPLDELETGAARLDPEKPIVLCCASGARSSVAAGILKSKGFKNVVNAGSWRNTL